MYDRAPETTSGGSARPRRDVRTPTPERPRSRAARRRRTAILYAVGAVVLIGWATYLGVSLPDRNIAQHWNAAWVGLDLLIVIALARTAYGAARGDRRVVLPAAATAALLVADAWMDIATASRADMAQSVVLALVVELPLAVFSILVARRALAHLIRAASHVRAR